ncbi:MAG: YIP1 family protein [Bacillota bacterium]|nr:YIP1 family protein [Bacillota bacterium]
MSARAARTMGGNSLAGALSGVGAMVLRPRGFLAALGDERAPGHGALRALGYEVGFAAALVGGLTEAASTTGGRTLPGGAFPATLFLFWVALSLVAWLAFAAVLQLTAGLLGGTGRVPELVAGLGLSYVPNLLAPLPVALAHLSGGGLAAAGSVVATAITVWHLVLVVLAVSAVHRLRAETAVGALLLPPAVLAGLGLIGLLPLVTGILRLLG